MIYNVRLIGCHLLIYAIFPASTHPKDIAMNRSQLSRIILLLMAFHLPCLTIAHGAGNTFKLIIFGDSLVDIGNDLSASYLQEIGPDVYVPGLVVPPTTRYDRGHFSNGPVVSDYLARKFKVKIKPSIQGVDLHTDSISYGYGGSETGLVSLTPGLLSVPGMLGQVDQYIAEVEANNVSLDDTVFFMWSGANDYQNSLAQGLNPSPFDIVDNIIDAATNIVNQGGKLLVIANLPDLGQTPICSIYGICDILSELTLAHNDLLAQNIAALNNSTAAKVILFDAYSLFNRLLADPAGFELPNNSGAGPASGCLFQPPNSFNFSNCTAIPFRSTSIFWDEIHPATEVHKIFAKEIWKKAIKKNLRN